ncbi:MAG: fibronectin type III domain-containing protein [Acidobacteria bacterium]|nr:fibronectin type III domain-containing protein [Acidobacteriota bacterium]
MPASLQTSARSRIIAAAAVLVPLLTSCASPGPPRPPSLHLPGVVTDLTAQRTGNQVVLHWTTPARTTDNLKVPEPLTAEICRDPGLAPASATGNPPCTVVLHIAVKPGPSVAADTLPATLTADPVFPLAYRVRILNPEGRFADASMPAVAAAGSAPPPLAALRVTGTRNGALIEWTALASPSVVELQRSLTITGTPKPRPKKSDLQLSPEEPANVLLRSSDGASSAVDAGGSLDRTAKRGQLYTYRAQRIRTATVNGKTLELRGELSPPVALNFVDTFPPATPTGLASVPSGSNGKAAIDLSWQPVAESDLAGYNVYRRAAPGNSAASGAFERLNTALILGPAFSDSAVTPGIGYTYRVTAVTAAGNESSPSAVVTETAQTPNP